MSFVNVRKLGEACSSKALRTKINLDVIINLNPSFARLS